VHLVLFLQLMEKSAAQKTQMMRLYLIRVQQAMLYLVPMRQLSKDLRKAIQSRPSRLAFQRQMILANLS
jgi:hypothetical protein